MTETEKHETNLKNWEFVRKMGKDEYERLNRNPSSRRAWYRCRCCGEEKDLMVRNFKKKQTVCPNGCHGGIKGGNYVIVGVDDVATTHPHSLKYFVEPGIAKTYKACSHKRVKMKCPHCGFQKSMKIDKLIKRGFSCNLCKDGISYPEKFVGNLLKKLGVEFIVQKPLHEAKYDFYIPSYNLIIETHGKQHYNERRHPNWKSYEEEHENDINKWMLAQLKLGKDLKYVVLDCRKSEMEWIKKSIYESELSELFDLSEIDWEDISLKSENSIVIAVISSFNNGNSIHSLMSEFSISRDSVIRYLKKGNELWLCVYDAKEEMRKNGKRNGSKTVKAVVVIKDNRVIGRYDSVVLCSQFFNYGERIIATLCRGERGTSDGKLHFIDSQKMGGRFGFYYLDSEDWRRDKHLYKDDKGVLSA